MARGTDRSLRAAIRQWRFPPALRIAPASPPAGPEELTPAGHDPAEPAPAAAPGPAPAPAPTPDGSGPPGPALDDRALADVATGLWRARRRMLEPGSDEPRPEVRKEFQHLQSAWDALTASGVKVQDHDGVRYTPGLVLEVLVFQRVADLDHEEVIETIRPSIYVQGRSIQLGQVIVGTPDEEGPEG
jgi:hypothetical protein